MDGMEFGRYRLIELLGRGGMGEVWRAFDNETQRVVAVKVLPPHLADDPTFEQRFRREAFAAAGLTNPHVVPIHNFGEINGRLYVDMRLIEGRDLHHIITEGPLPLPRAVSIVAQVASALQAAHRIGLVHRDVKPSNVLVDEEDFAYLIDFGIARAAGQTSMTATGNVIGTWAYMAPERLSTDKSDARADVYALACLLHECLTGSQPFPATSLERQIAAHIAEPPPRPSTLQPTVPSSMDAVISKGMAKSPDDRFQTVTDLATAARAAATTYPAPTPPPTAAPHDAQTLWSPSAPPGEPPNPAAAQGFYTTDPTRQQLASDAHGPAPLLSPPPQPPQPPAARNKTRRIALAGAGAVAVIIAVVAAIALLNTGSDRPKPAPTNKALPNTGPFTGTFTAAFGPKLMWDGTVTTGDSADPAFSVTWPVRSACGSNGCIATTKTNGHSAPKELVFDNIGGRWVAVGIVRLKCHGVETDAWHVISLQPQANGSMSGEATVIWVTGCFNKRTLTLNRTADTDVSVLTDPGALPARVGSPAEALWGRYDSVTTYANGYKTKLQHFGVHTDCLRADDRCISPFLASDGSQTYVYASQTWVLEREYDGACSKGGTDHIKWNATLPLPQPAQDPMASLTGHGYNDVLQGKCPSQAFDITFTRTGD